jgi:hypothetical protein
MLRSERWTELTTKGIYGKEKDRAVELAVFEDGDSEAEGALSEGGGEQAERQSAELSW